MPRLPAAVRLLHVTTVADSLAFLRGQAGYMRDLGFEVYAASSPDERLHAFGRAEGAGVFPVAMTRAITPAADLVALAQLTEVMFRLRPHIVHAHTPKGGLLGMLAAATAGVPVRIYHMRGLPLMTAEGWLRTLLSWTESLSCRLAHQVLCVSLGVRQVAIDERLCPPAKIASPASGSGNGVDALGRFQPDDPALRRAGDEVRRRLGLAPRDRMILFIGRLVNDKGVRELATAWPAWRAAHSDARLVLVGPRDERDGVPTELLDQLAADARVRLVGFDPQVAPYLAACELLVLPTYREGFGNVLLEAAAMRKPVVATDIPGCRDAVAHGTTGTLVPPRDVLALTDGVSRYLSRPELARAHGAAGRQRVLREFLPTTVWNAVAEVYYRLLRAQGQPCPTPREAPAGAPLPAPRRAA